MAKQRDVDKLLAIFSLPACQAFGLPDGVSTQVMFVYDREANLKEFNLLDNEMTRDMNSRITSWLKEHIGVDDILYGLNSKNICADDLSSLMAE